MEASTIYIETSVTEFYTCFARNVFVVVQESLADNVKKEKITKVHDIDGKADRASVRGCTPKYTRTRFDCRVAGLIVEYYTEYIFKQRFNVVVNFLICGSNVLLK